MHRRIRRIVAAVSLIAGVFAANPSQAVEPCPQVACVTIDGIAVGPHGERAGSYTVIAQRADGYNETTKTDAAGRFSFSLPVPPPSGCYQVVGISDAFYTVSSVAGKQCLSATVTLQPKYRINGISGLQKTYLGDVSQDVFVPVQVSALSRTFPAPFENDPLPWVFEHRHPLDAHGSGDAHVHHGATGFFPDPVARKIADGVWQYVWSSTIKLPGHEFGYYDMDWGRGTSVYSPMMECRMIWFGYGLSSLTPARAVPGQVVTLQGQRLGAEQGSVEIKGSGQVLRVNGPSILSWTDTKITFVVPPNAKNGWVAAVPPSGVKTNAQPLAIGV